ncbi:penicillin-binding transpeptidase domain-containing protein [Niabella sp. CJ426]|uniref:penicillin-binding transpeptidase domain-containing protein n=1 Tax=Niabella sp. CJ426 TaxID=3393740 RepID=UPI003CFCADF8
MNNYNGRDKTGSLKRNHFSFLFIGLALVMMQASCTQNNVKEDNTPKKYFDAHQLNGCFALYNNGTGLFTVYNLKRYRDSTYLPASTFKIINSLIGLQTGKISSDSMVIPWDGITRNIPDWNKDLNMYQAFRVSAVPYYQEVARRIGKDTMQFWLDSLKYGAGKDKKTYKISKIDSFWLDNTVKITPDQNLGIVKKLYFDELPFFKVYQQKVKHAMLFEDNSNYRLGYKTGWGTTDKGHALGWIVGWIEENKHPYFFVLNVESADPNYDMKDVRLKILKDILKEYGFFQGAM